ncbi:MAG: hypothetical protein AAB352_03225 [Patescibacteria group bacterium]
MEAIFTLPYSEYEVINQLKKRLNKSEFSFYVPTSRQEKGADFILHNSESNKHLRFQVKSSRAFADEPKISEKQKRYYKHNLWFNNFIEKCRKDNADYYILFGLYPVYQQGKNIKSKLAFWKEIIMCFSKEEMISLLKNAKTVREKKKERFFGFGFDIDNEIYCTRAFTGLKNDKEQDLKLVEMFSRVLIKDKLEELKEKLK